MTTELQIAKTNIESWVNSSKANKTYFGAYCLEHLHTCQRFLEFLERAKEKIVYVENELTHYLIDEEITDLKSAIKLYEENNI